MREYEMMFILKPDLSDEQIAEVKERLKKIIADLKGEFIGEAEGWGRKRLAYEIEKYHEGIYCVWNFKGEPAVAHELDRVIKLSDRVLRHMILRKDEK